MGVQSLCGERRKWLVLIYLLCRPTLLFTASKSDLKQVRYQLHQLLGYGDMDIRTSGPPDTRILSINTTLTMSYTTRFLMLPIAMTNRSFSRIRNYRNLLMLYLKTPLNCTQEPQHLHCRILIFIALYLVSRDIEIGLKQHSANLACYVLLLSHAS